MTLNITILGPEAIHQSADFQLSDPQQDPDGNWVSVHQNASKILALRFESWSGVITYCGIGLSFGKRTDQFVADWLSGIGYAATFHDVLELVRREGSAWIADVNRTTKKVNAHTFVLAAFEDGAQRIAVLSSCQSLNGDFPIQGTLQVDSRTVGGTHVFVTGVRDAVAEEDRRLLKNIAESIKDHAVVQHYLANVNRRAAQGTGASKGISRSCLVYSCGPNGAQSSRVHGDVQGPVAPLAVSGDSTLAELIAQFSRQNPNMTVVQSAYQTAEAQQAELAENIDCPLRFGTGFSDRSRAAACVVEEYGAINAVCLDAHAVNSSMASVGNIRILPDAFPRAYFSEPGGKIRPLDTFGGPFGNALHLNERNQVVGSAHTRDNAMHALLWTVDHDIRDLGTLGGKNSCARWINDKGVVVGTSGLRPGEPIAYDERAFVWTEDHGMVALDPAYPGWSRAIAINNSGWIVGWHGRTNTECGYVWAAEFGLIELTVGRGRPFFVSAINNNGLVVGEGDDENGKRKAYCWTRVDGVRRLNTHLAFSPRAVSDRGIIVGPVRAAVDGWERPFMCRHDSALEPLPYVEDHHTDVVAIDPMSTTALGNARRSGSWKHVHPLLWIL